MRLGLVAALWAAAVGCTAPSAPAPADEPAAPAPAAPPPTASAASLAAAPARAAARTFTVTAIGDCAIGDLQHGAGAPGSLRAELAAQSDPMGYPFSAVAGLLRNDDLTIANLEGTLTESRAAHNPVFSIRGEPGNAQILVRGGVDLVDLENNHSHDYGLEGFADTKAALERAGIGYFGGEVVARRVVGGLRVSSLGYLGGVMGTRDRMVRDVTREKRAADLVIVSFHWGVEGWTATHPDQQSFGRAAIDAGADLVLGHHPHVLQGIETYRGRHIVYSLGNFVFGANSQPADMDSMIVQEHFRFSEGRLADVTQTVLPVRISTSTTHNDFRPVLLEGAEAERVRAKLDELSRALPGAAGRSAQQERTDVASAPRARQGSG